VLVGDLNDCRSTERKKGGNLLGKGEKRGADSETVRAVEIQRGIRSRVNEKRGSSHFWLSIVIGIHGRRKREGEKL